MFLRFNSTMEGELLLYFDSFIISENALHFYGKVTKKNKKVLCNLHKTLKNIW